MNLKTPPIPKKPRLPSLYKWIREKNRRDRLVLRRLNYHSLIIPTLHSQYIGMVFRASGARIFSITAANLDLVKAQCAGYIEDHEQLTAL